jgi:hypothetical protein
MLTAKAIASLMGWALAMDGMYADNAGAFICRNNGSLTLHFKFKFNRSCDRLRALTTT